MIRKTRNFVLLGLVLAFGVSGVAFGDALPAGDASEVNDSFVTGEVTPNSLPKRDFHKAGLFTQSATDFPGPPFTGADNQDWSEQVFIDFDDDIKLNVDGPAPCDVDDIRQTTTAAATAACPDSIVGDGDAHARVPGYPTAENEATDLEVTVFDGPGNNIYLHSYSPSIDAGAGGTGATAQVVEGKIVASPLGGDFGKRLKVSDVPDVAGDNGGLTLFNATIKKGKYIQARCHDRNHRFNWHEKWVYDDGSSDEDTFSETCAVS